MKQTISISLFPEDIAKITLTTLTESVSINFSDDTSIFFHGESLDLFVEALSSLRTDFPSLFSQLELLGNRNLTIRTES